MATIEVECRACQSHDVYRHGKARSCEQRYRCKDCGHCFQLTYRDNGNQPGTTESIIDRAMKGYTRRVLIVSQGSKDNQRWLWYAGSPHFKTVFAYAFGHRTDGYAENYSN